MAAERLLILQERCEAAHRELFNTDENQEVVESEPPPAVMVPYLIDSRKKLKVMSRQLFVLDSMLQLLESLKSPDELLDDSCPLDIEDTSHKKFKALKQEYEEGTQAVQGQIAALQDKLKEANRKKEMLEEMLATLEAKKLKEQERLIQKEQKAKRQHSFKMQEVECTQEASRKTLQLAKQKIVELTAEMDNYMACLDKKTHLRDCLQWSIQDAVGLTGCRLVSVSLEKLCVELNPQVCQPSLGPVEPLLLSLTWISDGRFSLEVSQGSVGLPSECHDGPISQVAVTMLEVMHAYISQGEMLAEIQHLQNRFAIDWRPSERELVFLKSASSVCHLHVGEGYPSRGHISILSILREKEPLDFTSLKPPQKNPSLTQWLEFFTVCPHF